MSRSLVRLAGGDSRGSTRRRSSKCSASAYPIASRIWKDAALRDPILYQAKAEYAKLQRFGEYWIQLILWGATLLLRGVTQNPRGMPKTSTIAMPKLVDSVASELRAPQFPKSLDFGMPDLQFANNPSVARDTKVNQRRERLQKVTDAHLSVSMLVRRRSIGPIRHPD